MMAQSARTLHGVPVNGEGSERVHVAMYASDYARLAYLTAHYPIEDVLSRLIDASLEAVIEARKPHGNTGKRKPRQARDRDFIAKKGGEIIEVEMVRTDEFNLAFARARYFECEGQRIGGFGDSLSWASIASYLIGRALTAGHDLDVLARVGIRVQPGFVRANGWRYCPDVDVTLQCSSAQYMFVRITRLVDFLQIPIKIHASWENVPEACFPGRDAVIDVSPLKHGYDKILETGRGPQIVSYGRG